VGVGHGHRRGPAVGHPESEPHEIGRNWVVGSRPRGSGRVLVGQPRHLDDPNRRRIPVRAVDPLRADARGGGGRGLVVAGALAFVLVRYRERVPGAGQVRKALLLGVGALVLLTVLVEVPSKLRSDLADPGHWSDVPHISDALSGQLPVLGIGGGREAE
jgi:hypothetical protein